MPGFVQTFATSVILDYGSDTKTQELIHWILGYRVWGARDGALKDLI